MKKIVIALLMGVAAMAAGAQASVAGRQGHQLTITAGVMASGFNSDYTDPEYEGTNYLIGPGVYVDAHLTHWIQLEAEGRWMRWNRFQDGTRQDNYLIGPRVPIKRFGKFDTYGKFLIGAAKMNFPTSLAYVSQSTSYVDGTFTDLAFGGTLDYHLHKRWTVRVADFEYQVWPRFVPGESIHPFGVSAGIGYRVF